MAYRAKIGIALVAAAALCTVAFRLDHMLVPGVRSYVVYYRITYFALLTVSVITLTRQSGSLLGRATRWAVVGYGCGLAGYIVMALSYPHGATGFIASIRVPGGLAMTLGVPILTMSWLVSAVVGLSTDRAARSKA